MSELKSFMFAIIIGILFISIFGLAIADFSKGYDRTYDNTTFDKYHRLDEINEGIEEVRDSLEITEESSLFDIFGAYFRGGFKSLKVAGTSVDVVVGSDGLIQDLADDMQLGSATSILITTLSLLIIIIILFVLFKAIFKVDL